MSAPHQNELPIPTMYAPPWAREEARNAAVAATERAIAASEEFRNTLPPAPKLERRARWREREPKPFEGDVDIVKLRERASLDPVVMAPPPPMRGEAFGMLARVAGAVGLAALAAFFVVGTEPLKGAVKAEAESSFPAMWSRVTGALAERREFAEPVQAAAPEPLAVRGVQTVPVQIAAVQEVAPPATQPSPAEPASSLRALEPDEIATLYRRSEELIAQGDIASARLLLTRAAEAGDARSALALGATFDAGNLARLGVRGIAPDESQARAWYAKAAEFGSGEATRRLEQLAQASR